MKFSLHVVMMLSTTLFNGCKPEMAVATLKGTMSVKPTSILSIIIGAFDFFLAVHALYDWTISYNTLIFPLNKIQ